MSIAFRLPLRPFLRRSAPSSEKRVLLVRDDVIGDLLVPTSAVVHWLLAQGYDVYLVLRKDLMDIGELLLPRDRLLPVDIRLYRSSLGYRLGFLQSLRKIGFSYALGSTIHSSVNDDIVRSSGASHRWGYKRYNKLKENFRLRGIRKVISLPLLSANGQEYTSVVAHERHFLETAFKTTISPENFGARLHETAVARLMGDDAFANNLSEVGGFQLGGECCQANGEKNTRQMNCQTQESPLRVIQTQESHTQTNQKKGKSDLAELDNLRQKGGYIHYLAEAGAVKRVFPPKRMLPLLFQVADTVGMKVVITGLKRQEVEDNRCINLTGQTTLPQVLAIVANASLVVGNESGLTHLAWILGKRTALFYGGGHWGRFRPTGDTLLLNVPCEYRCCDWKCHYEALPVPCVNLADEDVLRQLTKYVCGEI